MAATPVIRQPMVLAHDAATAYIASSGFIDDWARTQQATGGDIGGLLDCGARALDWRPMLFGTDLIAHHGRVPIHHNFSDTLSELENWSDNHPSELVLLFIFDCVNEGCRDRVVDECASAGVALWLSYCRCY